jgi:hypothetical protein
MNYTDYGNEDDNMSFESDDISKDDMPDNITEEDKIIFKKVDRPKEDLMVQEYQKTGDPKILEELHKIRDPTIWVWARRYAWLDNIFDMHSEFSMVWLNCVNKYTFEASLRYVKNKDGSFVFGKDGKKKTVVKKTSFNTYMFTALINKARNIIKKRNGIKMLDDDGNSIEATMKSLDFEYGDEEGNMHDFICDDSHEEIISSVSYVDIVRDVAQGDEEISEILLNYAENSKIKGLASACKRHKGVLTLSRQDHSILSQGGEEATNHLMGMIISTGAYSKKFRIEGYSVSAGNVNFEIIMHNSKMLKKVQAAIRECRRRHGQKAL